MIDGNSLAYYGMTLVVFVILGCQLCYYFYITIHIYTPVCEVTCVVITDDDLPG